MLDRYYSKSFLFMFVWNPSLRTNIIAILRSSEFSNTVLFWGGGVVSNSLGGGRRKVYFLWLIFIYTKSRKNADVAYLNVHRAPPTPMLSRRKTNWNVWLSLTVNVVIFQLKICYINIRIFLSNHPIKTVSVFNSGFAVSIYRFAVFLFNRPRNN